MCTMFIFIKMNFDNLSVVYYLNSMFEMAESISLLYSLV